MAKHHLQAIAPMINNLSLQNITDERRNGCHIFAIIPCKFLGEHEVRVKCKLHLPRKSWD